MLDMFECHINFIDVDLDAVVCVLIQLISDLLLATSSSTAEAYLEM